jgi:glycosyltransferase involved in cell wall biosynthesis
MNYVIFHLDDSKNLRGGERQLLYLSKELNKLEIKNYIVSRKNSPIEIEAKKINTPVINLPYLFDWDIISSLILSFKIKKIAKKLNLKPIIHSHTGKTASIGLLASLFIGAPLVVHRRVDFKLKGYLSKLKYNKANYIIAVSEAIKKILTENGINHSKITVINSSIDLEKIKIQDKNIVKGKISEIYKINKNNIFIGSLIALVPHKDPLNLIRAAKYVIEKYRNVEFLICGEGELEEKCEMEIKNLGISNNFHLLGYCDNNTEILNALDIFVLPSKEEGLGSVLIEAMAVGLPIVATDAGGIPEIIKNGINGIIVPKQNPKELAEALIKLIENENLRKELSQNAINYSKNFSSKIMTKKTLEVYEKAIKNTKSN